MSFSGNYSAILAPKIPPFRGYAILKKSFIDCTVASNPVDANLQPAQQNPSDTMKKNASFPSLFLAAALVTVTSSQAALVFSDSFDSWSANYTSNNASTLSLTSTGLSSSTALEGNSVANSDTRGIYKTTGADFSAPSGAMLVVSTYFHLDTLARVIGLGLYPNSGSTGTNRSILVYDTTNGNVNVQNTGTGATNTSTVNSGTALTVSTWYYLAATFTKTPTSTLDVGYVLRSSDNAGVLGSALTSNTWTSVDIEDSQDIFSGNVYGGFFHQLDGRMDNFSMNQIPEPASALLLGLGGFMWINRRQRKA